MLFRNFCVLGYAYNRPVASPLRFLILIEILKCVISSETTDQTMEWRAKDLHGYILLWMVWDGIPPFTNLG